MSDLTHLTVTPEVLLQLAAPTPQGARQTRQGPHGKTLTYVDARYVQQVLDTELGPGNWQSEFAIGSGGKVACRIGIRVSFSEGPAWVFKGDGAGETDIEGEKGSFSDAFKRAGVAWGIARDLYGEDAPPVPQTAAVPQRVEQAAPVERPPLPPNTQPYQEFASGNGDSCPAGHGAWQSKPGGFSKRTNKPYDPFWACSGKTANGGYCNEKPGKAWVDAHPIAA